MKRLFAIAGLIALTGAGCFSASTPSEQNEYTPTPTTTETAEMTTGTPPTPAPPVTPPFSTESNQLFVANQPPGISVMVAYVKTVKRAYVVIQSDANGKPGTVLAESGLLFAGENKEVPVTLTTKGGTYYWATLRTDDGDGKFNPTKDVVTKDSKGAAVMMRFEAEDTANTKNDGD